MNEHEAHVKAKWHELMETYERAGWDASVLEPPTGRTIKSYARWMREHDGDNVDTMQVTVRPSGQLRNLFQPLDRVIDSHSRATYAVLDDSVRYYEGVRVVASDDRAVLAYCDFGDSIQMFLHSVV